MSGSSEDTELAYVLPEPTSPQWWMSEPDPCVRIARIGGVLHAVVGGQWVRLARDEHGVSMHRLSSDGQKRVMIHCDNPPLVGGWFRATPQYKAPELDIDLTLAQAHAMSDRRVAEEVAMPGNHKSIKKEDTYDALREKGYSKEKAARIANAQAAGTIDHKGKGRGKGSRKR